MIFSDKNVVYIGGFGGIGRKFLYELLEKRVKSLAIFDLNVETEILNDIQQKYGATTNIFFIPLDLTVQESIIDAYKEAAQRLDGFDIIVNGSGLMDDRYIEKVIQINLSGVIHSTFTAMNYMDKSKEGRGGVIVNIASVLGLQPNLFYAVYSATKSAVTGFTRALSQPHYYDRTGISFITICPGFTDTPLSTNPIERMTFKFNDPVLEKNISNLARQSPEICAKNILKIIETAKNGSIWILDMGEIEEVKFPF